MSLINDYQNSQNEETDTGVSAPDPADSRKKRADLERQIVMAESDLKKTLRKKAELEANQHRLKKDEERIRVERDALDVTIKKTSEEQRLLEEEIAALKKKLKTLPG